MGNLSKSEQSRFVTIWHAFSDKKPSGYYRRTFFDSFWRSTCWGMLDSYATAWQCSLEKFEDHPFEKINSIYLTAKAKVISEYWRYSSDLPNTVSTNSKLDTVVPQSYVHIPGFYFMFTPGSCLC